MSINEPRSIHAAEDWGVVLQSIPSKKKKDIVKQLEEIFELDKHDAERALSNMPLILLDNISFGLAARVKAHFQKIGAVVETTNHDMIKKNCFQIIWPQTPDLSFFLKEEEAKSSAVHSQEKNDMVKPAEVPPSEKSAGSREFKSETPKVQEAPASPKPADETPVRVAPSQPVSEAKPAASLLSSVDSGWRKRADELNEKLRKIQDEKQQLHVQHAEVTEKVKTELQQQLDQEKKKSQEIAKAYEDLQKQAEKHEALTKEGEEWRSEAMSLGEKIRELETNLMQKVSAIEHLVQQKDDLVGTIEKTAAAKDGEMATLQSRISELEQNLSETSRELSGSKDRERGLSHKATELEGRIPELEKSLSETSRELTVLRNQEQELLQKARDLEQNVQEMSGSLRARDEVLAQFEKQVQTLAEKAREYDSLRQEHAQLVQERGNIRKEYDAKLVEQEGRLAKVEEEHRRYRSRTDRKNAAATRELGEWVRGVDTVRQGLQKLILFLGSDSAVLETEKKSLLRSPLTRGPDAQNASNADKS